MGRIGSSARPPSPRRGQDRPEGGVMSEYMAAEYERIKSAAQDVKQPMPQSPACERKR